MLSTLICLFLCWSLVEPLVPLRKDLGPPSPTPQMPHITQDQIEYAFTKAHQEVEKTRRIENHITKEETIDDLVHSPEARHYWISNSSKEVYHISCIQQLFEHASMVLAASKKLTPAQASRGLPTISLEDKGYRLRKYVTHCRKLFLDRKCMTSELYGPYRTVDGSCNNRMRHEWGKSDTCYGRVLPASYHNGISFIRMSKTGSPLPSPRQVSQSVHREVSSSTDQTMFLLQWAQFQGMDIGFTPMAVAGSDMKKMNCCSGYDHPECFNIGITNPDDPILKCHRSCLNFVSSATCNPRCSLGPRGIANRQTAYIDMSPIYGPREDITMTLRTGRSGRLKTGHSGTLLHSFYTSTDQCSSPKKRCYQSGDIRLNEHPGLTTMFLIWTRLHNLIARILKRSQFCRDWYCHDEFLFQEARKVCGALAQLVTFRDYLPVLLGPEYIRHFELQLLRQGRSVYDSKKEAAIFLDYQTAAARYGHLMLRNLFEKLDWNYDQNGTILFREKYFRPFSLRKDTKSIVRGLFKKPAMTFNRFMPQAVTRYLYSVDRECGLDLASINIQRGRDHGLGPYIHYMEYFFGVRVRGFEDLSLVMTTGKWQLLRDTYKSVGDVDLFTGGACESSLPGGVVGPTFGAIIGLQYRYLKMGDRMYFEHPQVYNLFTDDELEKLRRVSLSSIVCTVLKMNKIPKDLFDPNSKDIPCEDMSHHFADWISSK